jgi:prepilin-type N-terminal cleavage/methylation domain-containing protein
MKKNKEKLNGFTLIEILVVCAVISVIVALSLPAFSAARRTSSELKCLDTIRQTSLTIQLYALDFRGFPPVSSMPTQAFANVEQVRRYLHDAWWSIYADPYETWFGRHTPGIYRCAAHPPEGQDPIIDEILDFEVSQAFYMPPSAFQRAPDERPIGLLWAKAKPQEIERSLFPAAKVLVFETYVWHAVPRNSNPALDGTSLSYITSPGRCSAGFVDGHARLLRVDDAVPAVSLGDVNPAQPLSTTRDGVLGRDWSN